MKDFFFSEDVLKQDNGECVICFENLSIGRLEPLPAWEQGIYILFEFTQLSHRIWKLNSDS